MTPSASSGTTPALPRGVREVREVPADAAFPHHVHPEWSGSLPWLVQGVTDRRPARDAAHPEPFDVALFGSGPAHRIQDRWALLARETGMHRLVHGRQVHEAAVRVHDAGAPGLSLAFATDGHVTRAPGVLLTVATADCIPVTVVDPERRAVAVLHAGWRGVVAGILERGLDVMAERFRSRPQDLRVHLGPAICGRCYEVGPEVFDALGLAQPAAPTPVDLRAALVGRVLARGVPAGGVTVSAHCTLCSDSPFFSHRGGDPERQVGFAGIRG